MAKWSEKRWGYKHPFCLPLQPPPAPYDPVHPPPRKWKAQLYAQVFYFTAEDEHAAQVKANAHWPDRSFIAYGQRFDFGHRPQVTELR